MKCQKCACEFVGNACPACGYPVLAMGGTALALAAGGGYGTAAYRVPVKGAQAKAAPKPKGRRVFSLLVLIPVLVVVAVGAMLAMQWQGRVAAMRTQVEQAVQAGGRDEAQRLLDGYVSADPKDEDVYLLYADFHLMEGDYRAALAVLETGRESARTTLRIGQKQKEILATYADAIRQEEEAAAQAERVQAMSVDFLAEHGWTREQAVAFLQAAGVQGTARLTEVAAVGDGSWKVDFEDGRNFVVLFAADGQGIATLVDRYGQYLIENGQENPEYVNFDDIDWDALIEELKANVQQELPEGAVYDGESWVYGISGKGVLLVQGSTRLQGPEGESRTVTIEATYRVVGGRLTLQALQVDGRDVPV